MLVVFGPRTHLAGALLALATDQAQDTVLVARNPPESQALSAAYPHTTVLQAGIEEAKFPPATQEVAVVCCGFGLIHPETVCLPDHWQRHERDLNAFRRVVTLYQQVPVHGIFVSSVVALGTPRRRAYYGGWKSVSEGAIEALLRDHPQPRFSVFFPGRLVEERSLRRLDSLLATPYGHLAKMILGVIHDGRARNRLVGTDARLWLLARMCALGAVAISGRVPTGSSNLRDTSPHI